MLLTISTTHEPATDLGYLLVKHPDRFQRTELAFGTASVFYPEATTGRCTAVLMVEVDPIGLVRGRGDAHTGPLAQYVNDRPYAANSLLAVAMKRVFSTAMNGTSSGRQALADSAIPLKIGLPVVRCHGGEERIRALFEPLGHEVEASRLPLNPKFPEWGESNYFSLVLRAHAKLSVLLNQLYVLLPALDGDKHYYVGEDEIDKLVAKAGDWLPSHPQKEWITSRYLKRRRPLVQAALARLLEQDEETVDEVEARKDGSEARIEAPIRLNDLRLEAVHEVLRQASARRVLDLGCGEGQLLKQLLTNRQFEYLLGIDVSPRSLEYACAHLKLERLSPMQQARIALHQGSLTYRDRRFEGFDAACVIEVIEHIDPPRLPAFVRTVFGYARPAMVIITTPNVEYNVRFEAMPEGTMRHPDHRFEWTRAQFRSWSDTVAREHGYRVHYRPVGPEDADLGPPTQMAVFERGEA